MVPATCLASVEWYNGLEVSPVSEEGVGGPASHALDDVWWNTRCEKLCCSTDAEAMACCAWVTKGGPNLVASGEKGGFRE